MQQRAAAIIAAILFLAPLPSFAFPFGGQIGQIVFCYNQAIWTNVGPPRGGLYIWTSSTRTYQFGPPTHTGQWLLGLASAPYYCLVSIQPIIVWPGIHIDMMGSSGQSGASVSQLFSKPPNVGNGDVPRALSSPSGVTPGATLPTPGSGTGTGTAGSSIGHIVISEVFSAVDSAHGSSPGNQWVELYNGTSGTVDLSGWTLQSGGSQSMFPNGTTISAGQFLVLVADSGTVSMWPIPEAAKKVSLGSSIAGGIPVSSGALILKSGITTIDALSWGENTSIFSPATLSASPGMSLSRMQLTQDTDTRGDWGVLASPTPGR